jgi:LmbE family N-acetylglucosaminyl deacetylase
MTFLKRAAFALALAGCLATRSPQAQMRAVPVDELQGHAALGLSLRHLGNTGIFMMTTAHPDDENNGLLVMLNRGLGFRTALATATRGNGGQNEIGPELFEALGVLRTEELAAVHRFDGAEQYFTRAVDFGYSFSVEETFEKWGREDILGDYVRLIRTVRPDVITALAPAGAGGGQHHEASAILAREAFAAAADPQKFPEQIAAGLRPWQPSKFYFTAARDPRSGPGATPARQLAINLAVYDRLLGKTYAEIGSEARSLHKCQGTQQLFSLPGPATSIYELAESTLANGMQRPDASLFDGIDTTVNGLARFAGAKAPKMLTDGLEAINAAVQLAQRRFESDSDAATLAPLLTGLSAVRALRGQLRAIELSDAARFEIDIRLRQKERELQQSILLANAIRVDALADDGVIVPGQAMRVSVSIANRGDDVAIKQVKFDGFVGSAACALTLATGQGRGATASPGPPVSTLSRDQVALCAPTVVVPEDARVSEPYWHRDGQAGRYTFDDGAPFGVPHRPTPFYVQVTFGFPESAADEDRGGKGGRGGRGRRNAQAERTGTIDVFGGLPVTHRYAAGVFAGEKRSELMVVPPASVQVSPDIAIVPSGALAPAPPPPAARARTAGSPPRPTGTQGRGGRGAPPPPAPDAPAPAVASTREVRVTVLNTVNRPADHTVRLDVPEGWSFTPPQHAVKFAREDEMQTVRFDLKPAPSAGLGEYQVKAIAVPESAAGANAPELSRGFQVIEYPHIRRQHIYRPAATTVKVIDVKIASTLTVGYIMGVGDAVPPAIEQLGAKVEMVSPEDLAWGNLSRFSTIVTGVRAYESRADLRANNGRLLEYVRGGGTLIVQYNKMEFNEAQYGPYAAQVTTSRVTDEDSPVRIIAANDPVFNVPNRITDAAWSNWVQERGLYFLDAQDSRYRELVSLADPFPFNSGDKRGALVSAQYGRGRWVYVGLALWRELPAGVDGAYQLLANLISLGH